MGTEEQVVAVVELRVCCCRPTQDVAGPPALTPSRHSTDILLDSVETASSTTLPRSPIKPSFFKVHSYL